MDPIIARFREARRQRSLAVVEGFHALKHAIRFDADLIEIVTANADRLHALAAGLAPDVAKALRRKVATLPPETLAALVPEPHPPDVIAIATRPPDDDAAVARGDAALVLLERPTQLGNIGAVVRVAAAAGARGVVTTGPADPWHPHAIRGSAGLHFALPVQRCADESLDRLLEVAGPLVALHPEGEPLRAGCLPPRAVLAFGSERTGLSPDLLARAGRRFAIPMQPGVSSLNLATAVAVALYLGCR